MSFQQFSQKQYAVPIDTGVIGQLGSYTLASAIELKHAVLSIYIHGTIGGTERARLHVYGNSSYAGALATSSWSNLSSISNLGTYWLGNLRLDFARENLAVQQYWVGLELGNYTRNADAFFVGFLLDWPEAINTPQGSLRAAALRLVGYV